MSAHEHAGNGIKAVTGDEAVSAGGRDRGFTRRRLVGAAGVAGLMGVSGFGGEVLGRRRGLDAAAASSPDELRYPFRGEVQQGILTPAQDTMYTVAYTVTTRNRDGLRRLLTAWTSAAEKMVAGEPVGGAENDVELPPSDTGEVWGYPPSGLTITFGFGRSLFVDEHGGDRFGLKDRMPRVLADGVPKFANEALRAAASDGDILIQTCSNDPQVCVHAVRNLTRMPSGPRHSSGARSDTDAARRRRRSSGPREIFSASRTEPQTSRRRTTPSCFAATCGSSRRTTPRPRG